MKHCRTDILDTDRFWKLPFCISYAFYPSCYILFSHHVSSQRSDWPCDWGSLRPWYLCFLSFRWFKSIYLFIPKNALLSLVHCRGIQRCYWFQFGEGRPGSCRPSGKSHRYCTPPVVNYSLARPDHTINRALLQNLKVAVLLLDKVNLDLKAWGFFY